MTAAAAPALSLRGIDRRCGDVMACRGVDLEVPVGQVHALVGENGAGKTTLMKIAHGLMRADRGSVSIRGTELTRPSARQAIALGLGMVHQHFMLAPSLTVVENVVLGREPVRGPFATVDYATASAELVALGARYRIAVQPGRLVSELGVGEKQRVEILKVLWRGAEVVILDEPTAVLGPAEVQELLAVVRELRAAGKTVVMITHKLDEVMAVADAVTVLRRGQVTARLRIADTTPGEIARAMVGRDVARASSQRVSAPGDVVLAVERLAVARPRGGLALDGVSLQVRAGEVLGVAGVDGNGQSELLAAIAGLTSASGTITLNGRDLGPLSVAGRLAAGLGHVPEDRQHGGLSLDQTVEENLMLGRLGELPRRFLGVNFGIDRARLRAEARRLCTEYDIRPGDPQLPARSLSGGNQQKVVLARELSRPGLKLLLLAQPTRGVDLGAAAALHRRVLAARDAGVAVLLISAELPEILALSDRVVVLLRGRISGELARDQASEASLSPLMTAAESPHPGATTVLEATP